MADTSKHTIAVLVENKFGVLSRVAGLFSARGYNIESLSVGETLDPSVSRMTLVVRGDAFVIEQVIKQLHKLIDVIKVTDLTEENHVEREMLLLRVNAEPANRAEILRARRHLPGQGRGRDAHHLHARGHRARSPRSRRIIELLRPFGIQEIVRTGKVAIARGPKTRLRKVEEQLGKPREAPRADATIRRWSGSRTDFQRTRPKERHEETMPAKIYYDQDADLGLLRGKNDRHHRLRQPGPRPRPEPEGLRPGRGRRALQGLEELGQGREGRAQGRRR